MPFHLVLSIGTNEGNYGDEKTSVCKYDSKIVVFPFIKTIYLLNIYFYRFKIVYKLCVYQCM